MSETTTESHLLHLDDYVPVVGAPEITELRTLAAKLSGRTVQMVNSTAVGGGVAEILNRLVPLMQELTLEARWDVLTGGNDFFEVTKSFHNALHGGPYQKRKEDFELFLATNESNRQRMKFDCEFTVIHDPQPVALIEARTGHTGHWIWRCHIDLSQPNQDVWEFLRPFIHRYDASLFSSPSFARQLPIPQYLFYPCIDPLSEKNIDLESDFVSSVLERFHIDPARPIVTQISRFDRLKDPAGVVRAYQIVKRYQDCQLVLAGGGAADDPEGGAVLEEVRQLAAGGPGHSHSRFAALERARNQRAATGFHDHHSEESTRRLWPHRDGGAVEEKARGGLRRGRHSHADRPQAHRPFGAFGRRDGLPGSFLAFESPPGAQKLGEQGREHVREHFLITSNVRRYLTLFLQQACLAH